MLQTVKQYITKKAMPVPNAKLVVAVSGGIDSVVLLDILVKLGYQCIVAHCNFHLRGEESDGDEKFVAEIAKSYRIPFRTVSFDTKEEAAIRKISIEMAARELRYTWFEELLETEQCAAIAVAHHANDATETFFLNLIRGTGIRGLLGIKACNHHIIRPLLCCQRATIEAYAIEHSLQYRTDSSNNETVYVRNKIRHALIPECETINVAFMQTMTDNMERLSDITDILNYFMADIRLKMVSTQNGLLIIKSELLKTLPAPNTILFELLRPYNFNTETVTHIYQSLDGLSGKTFYSSTHRAIINRDEIIVNNIDVSDEKWYHIEENTKKISQPISLEFIEHKGIPIIKKDVHWAYIDIDKLIFPLKLRRWQTGDTFIPLGMTNHKKVSDYFIDEKLSIIEKENTWLLTTADDTIIWIVGKRLDNRFRVNELTSKQVLIVKYHCNI